MRRTYDKQMDFASAVVTLFFVMDPLGNIAIFNGVLSRFPPGPLSRSFTSTPK